MKNMTNCLWVTGGGNATIDPDTSANVITVAKVSDALAMLDGDYRPRAGTSIVDAGDRALLVHLAGDATTDLGGGQRIYGGQVDIGAYEYDLRPAMSAALHRKVSVASASTEATLGGGNVYLPEGEIVVAFSQGAPSGFVLPVQVTGSGTFSVFVGDSQDAVATATSAAGATELRFDIPAGETVRFAYAPGENDSGLAILGALAGTDGLIIFIR